jgi:hypothetical protein
MLYAREFKIDERCSLIIKACLNDANNKSYPGIIYPPLLIRKVHNPFLTQDERYSGGNARFLANLSFELNSQRLDTINRIFSWLSRISAFRRPFNHRGRCTEEFPGPISPFPMQRIFLQNRFHPDR